VKLVRRGNIAALQVAHDAAARGQPTWSGEINGSLPAGFHAETYRRLVGHGDLAFKTAVETVLTWGVQRGSGLIAHVSNERVRAGDDVVVGLPMGPFMILAPCRVSEVFNSSTRGGFRYVTLRGHPEIGHEEFVVERDGDAVWFVVRPVSRPGSLLTRLGGPLSRLVQKRASHRYLDAVAERCDSVRE
jgi:uncharacterized protein (UPF0548 family)